MPRKTRSEATDRSPKKDENAAVRPVPTAIPEAAPAAPSLGGAAPPEIQQFGSALARIEQGKIKAISDGDRVVLMIQDAPDQLRRLAAALERINVTEIQALVAYMKPEGPPRALPEPEGKLPGRPGQ